MPSSDQPRVTHTIHCWDCGHMQVGSGPLLERCPGCGHPLRWPKDGYTVQRSGVAR